MVPLIGVYVMPAASATSASPAAATVWSPSGTAAAPAPTTPSTAPSACAATSSSTACASPPWSAPLTGQPLLHSTGGPLRAEIDLTVVSSGSDGRERVKVHRIAAAGDTAEALASLPAGARVRLRAALRQIFVSNADRRLEGRPARVEARSFKLLSRKGRKR